MKQTRYLGFHWLGLLALALVGMPNGSVQGHELSLPSTLTVFAGKAKSFDVTISVDPGAELQGVQAIAEWNAGALAGTNIEVGPILAEADTVIPQIDTDHFLLGVVMDSNPMDPGSPEVIPAGSHVLATISVQGVAEGATTTIAFVDGKYGANPLSPNLENIVVAEGRSIGAVEGLGLKNTPELEVQPLPPGSLAVEDVSTPKGATRAVVPIRLSSGEAVQGYQLSVEVGANGTLEQVTTNGTDADAVGIEVDPPFLQFDVNPNGFALGVIFDFDPPFDDQTLTGDDQSVALLTVAVNDPPASFCEEEPPREGSPVVVSVTLKDGLGSPPKENLIVIAGLSKNPELTDGAVTFNAPECVTGFLDRSFAAGGGLVAVSRSQVDPREYELKDGNFVYVTDGFGNRIPAAEGAPDNLLEGGTGETVPISFYYTSPPTGFVDEDPLNGNLSDDLDDVQGVQMVARYGVGLSCDGSHSLDGSIAAGVGAEFVAVSCEDESIEGGGSITIGVLVDALPPFDGQAMPPTEDYLKVVTVNFRVVDTMPCGATASVEFIDGLTGGQSVQLSNVISTNNSSILVPFRFGATVEVGATPSFKRGDCNADDMVDIADAASVISTFLPGNSEFRTPCQDACDANDDGRIDLADAVTVLRYLFKSDDDPPSPGPNSAGPDGFIDAEGNFVETIDKLDCRAGTACPTP